MQSYIIGVDIGTGSAKAVAVDSAGKVIAASQVHYSMLQTPHGYSEQNPEVVWHAFVNCMNKVVDALQQVPLAVSFSSCMHSLILVDKGHLPITNLISWADTRSKEIAGELRESENAERIYRHTGTPIHSMSLLCKIIWFQRNAREIFLNAAKFISIKEFIWFRLFNAYQVDQSMACGTGLVNIEKLQWNDESMGLCGITRDALSEIVSTGFVRNDINPIMAEKLGIPANTQFCIGAGDGPLANLGSLAMAKGTAAITIGTSGAVRVASASPVYNFRAMIFNYILDEETFICGGPVNNGGNILQWLMHSFLKKQNDIKDDYSKVFNEIDNVVPGSQGLILLPFLNGERAPVWDEKSCGVFFGIKSYHNQSHFLRAALEGVCYALRSILQILEQSTQPIYQLNVSGGFIESRIWVQTLADVTGKKICLVQHEDASAIGAALLYMKTVNIIEDYLSLRHDSSNIVEPIERNHLVYEKYYSVYIDLFKNMEESMHSLAAIQG